MATFARLARQKRHTVFSAIRTTTSRNELGTTVSSPDRSLICPLLSGPIFILGMATKEEWNGKEAQAGRYHWQAA